jgi:hypothetical protein
LYLLLRPGPYIASEWRNCGIPDHATGYHKLHPEFLERAETYIEAVCNVIKPYLVTNGGPIILVQCDNEIDLNVQQYSPSDGYPLSSPEYTRQVFLDATVEDAGTFPRWLMEKYGNIRHLNRAYGTACRDFDEVDLLSRAPITLEERQRLFDANEFLEWYSTTYLREIVAMYKQAGISVPLYTNVYGRPQPMNYVDMQGVVDLLGADFYLSDLVSKDELLRMSFSIRHLASATAMPFIAELQSGTAAPWSRERGVVSPQHHRYMALLAMLCGAKAWNWYMLVNRDEWYCSPINEKGEQRDDLYSHFKEILHAYENIDWSSFERPSKLCLVWYRPHHWLSRGLASLVTSAEDVLDPASCEMRDYWKRVFDNIHHSGIGFDIFDPSSRRSSLCNYTMVLYAGYDFIDEGFEEQILEYVRAGGTFVILTTPPRKTLKGELLSLSEILPPVESIADWGSDLTLEYGNVHALVRSNWIRYFELEKYPTSIAILGLGGVVGYFLPFGKGRFCVTGWDVTTEGLGFLYEVCGLSTTIQTDNRDLLVEAFTRNLEVAVMVLNTGLAPAEATLTLDLASLGIVEDRVYQIGNVFNGEISRQKGGTLAKLEVRVGGKDGLIYHIVPADM